MINSRLLNEFKSSIENNKTVVITNIECKNDSCGQEMLIITTEQISKSFEEFKKGYDVINKTLEVEGHLDLNDDKEFYTNLVGFISNESVTSADESSLSEDDILNDTYRSPTSHYIEIIKTPLSGEMLIEFNKEYDSKPNVIITIDKKDEDLYRNYSTEFIKNSFGNKYSGVKITFYNLKSKNSYPDVGITIIGDPIESYYDGVIKTETKTEIHFLEGLRTTIHLFEMIKMIRNDIKKVKVIITDEDGDEKIFYTDNCGEISTILKFGEYSIKIDDDNYDSTEQTIQVSEENNSFELGFNKIQNDEEDDNEEDPNNEGE